MVDFGAARPYPAYLREHSPDYGSYQGRSRQSKEDASAVPGFRPASELLREAREKGEVAHSDAEASPSPEAGRSWASSQLVFKAGQFESARSGFADYAKDGETGEQLRTRVNRIILDDLEQKVLALRALHAKLHDMDAGESFGAVVARSRLRSESVLTTGGARLAEDPCSSSGYASSMREIATRAPTHSSESSKGSLRFSFTRRLSHRPSVTSPTHSANTSFDYRIVRRQGLTGTNSQPCDLRGSTSARGRASRNRTMTLGSVIV